MFGRKEMRSPAPKCLVYGNSVYGWVSVDPRKFDTGGAPEYLTSRAEVEELIVDLTAAADRVWGAISPSRQ